MKKTKFYKACMMLDRLQVELCKDTPYDIPTAEQTRERILKAMDLLDEFDNEEITMPELCGGYYGEDKEPAFGENIPLSTSELMKKLNEIEGMLGTLTNRDRRFKEFLEEIGRMRYELRWMMNSESFGQPSYTDEYF